VLSVTRKVACDNSRVTFYLGNFALRNKSINMINGYENRKLKKNLLKNIEKIKNDDENISCVKSHL